jgi:hypothetical protein
MRGRIILTCGAALAGASLLVTGCGGGSAASSASSSSPDGSPQAQASTQVLGYATCMRSHGVAGYPDPVVSGSGNSVKVTMSPGSANPDSPAFRSAERACHRLLPNGGEQGGAGGSSAQQQAQDMLFADCVRSHGVPSFPDPDHDGVFTLPATIHEQAPTFLRATRFCQKAQPTSLSIDQGT